MSFRMEQQEGSVAKLQVSFRMEQQKGSVAVRKEKPKKTTMDYFSNRKLHAG